MVHCEYSRLVIGHKKGKDVFFRVVKAMELGVLLNASKGTIGERNIRALNLEISDSIKHNGDGGKLVVLVSGQVAKMLHLWWAKLVMSY